MQLGDLVVMPQKYKPVIAIGSLAGDQGTTLTLRAATVMYGASSGLTARWSAQRSAEIYATAWVRFLLSAS